MLATELKKANFKSTLQLLVKEFNAHNFEDEMGGRKVFWIPDNDGDDIDYHHRKYIDNLLLLYRYQCSQLIGNALP